MLDFSELQKVLNIVFVDSKDCHGVLGYSLEEKVSYVVPVRSMMVLANLLLVQRTMLRASLKILTQRTSKEPSKVTKTSAKLLNLKSMLTTVKRSPTMIWTEVADASSI